MKPTTQLTKQDVEKLRRKKTGTNSKFVFATEKEVKQMQKHLGTIFPGKIHITFAEMIYLRNQEY